MTRAVVLLAVIASLGFAARSFAPGGHLGESGSVLAFGFLLLAAILTGRITNILRLTHLTGFIVCGAAFGPRILGLVTEPMVEDLSLVRKVAVGLIALTAGCELNLRQLWPRLRAIGAVSVFALGCTFVVLFVLFTTLSEWLPFMAGLGTGQRVVVSLVCATVLSSLSPAVVMGVVSETRSKGPLTEIVLSVVVLADLAIVFVFSLTESAVRWVFPDAQGHGGLSALAIHILGSVGIGLAVGAVFALYIRHVKLRVGLFIFGVSFVVAEAGGALDIDPLLAGLAAGVFLENVSPVGGHRVIHETEPAAAPIYAIFFATVGASIDVDVFLAVAGFAVVAAIVRALGLWAGVELASRTSGLARGLARRVALGMLPQAGIAIGLANLVKEEYQPWGGGAAALLLGTVLVNQMVGPALFRIALVRAGEVGRRDEPEPTSSAVPGAAVLDRPPS